MTIRTASLLALALFAAACAAATPPPTEGQQMVAAFQQRPDFVACLAASGIDPDQFTTCVTQANGDPSGSCNYILNGSEERRLISQKCAALSRLEAQREQSAYTNAHPTVVCNHVLFMGVRCQSY